MTFFKVKDLYFFSVLLLIRLSCSIGSFRFRSELIRFLGWLAFHLSFTKRRNASKGVSIAFGPKFTGKEKEGILRSSFQAFWSDTFSILPLREELKTLDLAVVEGEELLENALARGKGLILLESNGFGGRMIAKQILSRKGIYIHQVHVENHLNGLRNEGMETSWLRKSLLRSTFERWEREFVTSIIHIPESESLSFTRTVKHCLDTNGVLCSAGDGGKGQKLVRLPFLGRSREFATGMFSLSALSGAPILPVFCYRDPKDRLKLVIGPERNVLRNQVVDSLRCYVKQLENYVVRYPEQYRNWHFAGDSL